MLHVVRRYSRPNVFRDSVCQVRRPLLSNYSPLHSKCFFHRHLDVVHPSGVFREWPVSPQCTTMHHNRLQLNAAKTEVLAAFNCSRLAPIHLAMSSTQVDNWLWRSPDLLGKQKPYTWVSSAYKWVHSPCLVTRPIRSAVYSRNRIGPKTALGYAVTQQSRSRTDWSRTDELCPITEIWS